MKIVVIYQSLLGVHGDRGNALVLAKRLQWRGIDAQVVMAEPGTPLPSDAGIYLLGGGEENALPAAVDAIRADGGLVAGLDAGGVLFAVSAGYQISGRSYVHSGEVHTGLGLLDVETRQGPRRAVGEVLATWTKPDGADSMLTGFENHIGYTYLGGDAALLATVHRGLGNNGDGTEGAVQGRTIGTNLHGPALARNPNLADHVLELALGRPLEPLGPEHGQVTRETLALRQERERFARR